MMRQVYTPPGGDRDDAARRGQLAMHAPRPAVPAFVPARERSGQLYP